MNTYLEFEKPIEQLDNKVHELKSLNDNAPSDNLLEEITQVEEQINETYRKIYSSISPSKFFDKISLISLIKILTSGMNSISPSGTRNTP